MAVARRVGSRPGVSGDLKPHDFLYGIAEATKVLLPAELRNFQQRVRGPLIKLHYGDRHQHFEVCLRRSAGLVELGLHFESRDRARNAQLLDWFADELIWIKAELGEQTEAEPWDRGWTRIHRTVPLESLDAGFQHHLAEQLAQAIQLLEPLRREAAESLG